MKKIFILSIILLSGCASITEPKTNYAKVGLFQDRFDGMYYHYAETGKSININDTNSINMSLGYQEGSGSELINKQDNHVYWDVNYQIIF